MKKILIVLLMVLTMVGVSNQRSNQVNSGNQSGEIVTQIAVAAEYPYPTNPPWPGYNMGTWLVNTYDYNVEQLQYRLTSFGFSTNGVDGYYGSNTEKAVHDYQYWHGLMVDGICGEQTWNDLFQ